MKIEIEKLYGLFEKTRVYREDAYKDIVVLTDDGAEKLLDKINEIVDFLNSIN